jgi:hypothetical protein
VSELDAAVLARHVRLLLRCYPKAYRAHRGEEILGTLLETTRPGRGWPPPREVASVIGGGLRARRAVNLSQGLRASLRHVGILAVVMVTAGMPAALLFTAGQHIAGQSLPYDYGHREELGLALGSLLVVTALAATWCGRRWLVAVTAAAGPVMLAALVGHLAKGGWTTIIVWGTDLPTALALVVLVPLVKRAERPPFSLLWLPLLTAAVGFVEGVAAASGLSAYDSLPVPSQGADLLLPPYATYLSLVPLLVAVCWLVTDVRPLAALALQSTLMRFLFIAFDTHPGRSRTQLPIVAGLLLLALSCGLVWLLRHRARTAPPTTG